MPPTPRMNGRQQEPRKLRYTPTITQHGVTNHNTNFHRHECVTTYKHVLTPNLISINRTCCRRGNLEVEEATVVDTLWYSRRVV